jgi:hypothetical protein
MFHSSPEFSVKTVENGQRQLHNEVCTQTPDFCSLVRWAYLHQNGVQNQFQQYDVYWLKVMDQQPADA